MPDAKPEPAPLPESPTPDAPDASWLRLRLYADRDAQGEVCATFLILDDRGLSLWTEPQPQAQLDLATLTAQARLLPAQALPVLFARYGKPLSADVDIDQHAVCDDAADAPLVLTDGQGTSATLRRFRYKPFGWVYPADYLLWSVDGAEPLAAPAPLVTAALNALSRPPSSGA